MVRTPVLIPSPDGRHAVRKDVTRVAVDEVPILGVGPTATGLFGRAKPAPVATERRYGLCYQLWEVDPARFLGRVVVAWLSVEDMPDAIGYSRGADRGLALAQRQAYWDAIAWTLLEHAGGPEDDEPPPTAYPSWFQADERFLRAAAEDLDLIAERWIDFSAWQPDGAAFWTRTNGFHTCVGLDGSASPRLWLERKGLQANTWLPFAVSSDQLEGLPGRLARETFADGAAILDGSPSVEVMYPAMVPVERDGWVPGGTGVHAAGGDATGVYATGVYATGVYATGVDATTTTGASATAPGAAEAPGGPPVGGSSGEPGNRITITVPAWTTVGVTEAIDALTAMMTPELAGHAEDFAIELRFAVEGRLMGEGEFFDRVGQELPDTLPALRRLVETAADAMARSTFLFSDSAEGVGLLSRAVRWVGVLDVGALPTLMAYGRVVEAEHEYTFVGETVPGIVRVHGWTDETIDFIFWVLIRNFFNGLQDFDEIWSGLHLRGAITQRDPVAVAHRVVELNRDDLVSRRYAVQGRPGGLEQLAADIPQPHEPWAVSFFAAAREALAH